MEEFPASKDSASAEPKSAIDTRQSRSGHLRMSTKRTLDRNLGIAPALQKLYQSPEAYAEVTNEGYAMLQTTGVRLAHRFVVKAVPYAGPELQRGSDGELPLDRLVPLIAGMEGRTRFFQVGRKRLAAACLAEGMPEPKPSPIGDTPREYRQRIVTIEHFMSHEAIATAVGISKAKLIEGAF